MSMKGFLLTAVAAAALVSPVGAIAQAQGHPDRSSEIAQSRARPNVFLWMLDDVGFGQLGSYGGMIETPNIDRMAKAGVRYANYHSTPLCSPSRASVLMGRNPHTVHVGSHAFTQRPFPGYDVAIPRNAGTIAENLRQAGYATYAFGKWDHLPSAAITPEAPRTYWPSGQGFDHYYGFLGADSDNWQPTLVRDDQPINAPREKGYHLNHDLADQAIAMIDAQHGNGSARPFFAYWATGTAHAPHHAPQRWIDHYKGRFDAGWDAMRIEVRKRQIALGLVPAGTKLAPMPAEVPQWDSLSADQKRLYARQMEVYAASVSYADEEFGRVLDRLSATGQLDNTLVLVTSDNGASAEGGPRGNFNEMMMASGYLPTDAENARYMDKWGGPETNPHYAFGWAVAGNTPFRYFKQSTFEGGERVPLVISWPGHIRPDDTPRGQYVHVSDIMPTILDLANAPIAAKVNGEPQMPLDGTSFADSTRTADAPGRKHVQYTELWGSKGLWSDGWAIATMRTSEPWNVGIAKPRPYDDPWQLFDLNADPGQTTDLAARFPEKVAELNAMFDEQARTFNVYPIGDTSESGAYLVRRIREALIARKGKWRYAGMISHIGDGAGPPVRSGSFTMTARVGLPRGTESGPIFALGGIMGGLALHIDKGVPVYTLRPMMGEPLNVAANRPLGQGEHKLTLKVTAPRPSFPTPAEVAVEIRDNDAIIAQQTVRYAAPHTPFSVSDGFDVGIDTGSTVSPAYSRDTPFSGALSDVTFDFSAMMAGMTAQSTGQNGAAAPAATAVRHR